MKAWRMEWKRREGERAAEARMQSRIAGTAAGGTRARLAVSEATWGEAAAVGDDDSIFASSQVRRAAKP